MASNEDLALARPSQTLRLVFRIIQIFRLFLNSLKHTFRSFFQFAIKNLFQDIWSGFA